MRGRRWVGWATIFLLWTAFSVAMAIQAHYSQNAMGYPLTWARAFRSECSYGYLWALLTPLILWIARKSESLLWYQAVPIHALVCVVFSAAQKTMWVLLVPPLRPSYQLHDFAGWVRAVIVTMDYGVMLYVIVLLIYYAAEYHTRYQAGRVKASQLETRLAQAQLQALKMQLHPHFLFNTLNSISTLVQEDPEAAESMVARLSELLRMPLENTGAQLVPLATEVQFLERYLEIEQIRFEGRLRVRFEIDPQTLDAQVPNLILQPLVENAIRHGIAHGSRAGSVEIRSGLAEGRLLLQIIDDGIGLRTELTKGRSGQGVGLSNTRARLEGIYGKAHNFVLRNTSKGGVEAAITIPFERPPQPERDDGNGKNSDLDSGRRETGSPENSSAARGRERR